MLKETPKKKSMNQLCGTTRCLDEKFLVCLFQKLDVYNEQAMKLMKWFHALLTGCVHVWTHTSIKTKYAYMLHKESLHACVHTHTYTHMLFQALHHLEPDYKQILFILKLLPSLSPAFQLQTRDDTPYLMTFMKLNLCLQSAWVRLEKLLRGKIVLSSGRIWVASSN